MPQWRDHGDSENSTGKVTAGLAESNGSLPPGGRLKVTFGLTACTPGSAPVPALGNEYERTFLPVLYYLLTVNTFKNRLDRFWSNQDVLYDYRADLHGIINRTIVM